MKRTHFFGRDVARTTLRWGGLAFLILLSSRAASQDVDSRFRFGFTSYPERIVGAVGEVRTFELLAAVTSVDNDTGEGLLAWQMSLGIEGGTIESIRTDGVKVSTIYFEDDDGDPDTPPIRHDPYEEDLVPKPGLGFRVARVGFHTLDPDRQGAITAVHLRFSELMMLQPTGTQGVARLRVSVRIGEDDRSLRLFYENGFRAPDSMWVDNAVTFQYESHPPVLGSVTIPVESRPAVPIRLGDANADGAQNLTDAVFALNFLFGTGPAPPCHKTVDLNGDGRLDISDPIFLLNFLFFHEATPREPYRECGFDSASEPLSCDSYPPCGGG